MLSRSLLIFLSFLYVFIVMSSLTVEKLEEILEEKLQKLICPYLFFLHLFSLNFLSKLRLCLCVCVFVYLLTKSLVHLTLLKTIVISTKDGCPTSLANDGYFGQGCTLFYFYSCLFCKFKLTKGANKVVVVVVAKTVCKVS